MKVPFQVWISLKNSFVCVFFSRPVHEKHGYVNNTVICDESNIQKVKLSLCLTKHHAMKVYLK
jgi:hypothetical protein